MTRFTLIDARDRPAAAPPAPEGLDRREALAWLAAGSAALLAGCEGKPPGVVAPAVEGADGTVPGEVRRYATTVPLAGYDRGVVGLCRDGRPVKLEGSPHHPASLGATDVFAEAEILSLYDPGRLRTPETDQGPQSWDDVAHALAPRMARARARGGEGLTLFTGRITSPTELRLIRALQADLPRLAWRRWEPTGDDAAREGSRLAFGRVLDVRPRLAECATVLCLDADPLGPGPDQIAHARAFAAARAPGRTPFLRLYAAEPGWSLTGMNADHRFALRSEAVTALAYAVAERFGLPPSGLADAVDRHAVEAIAADLQAAQARAVVLAGPNQPAQVHALAHWLNAKLAAPVDLREPADPHGEDHAGSLSGFRDDLQAGRVETLLVLDSNPAFGAVEDGGASTADLLRRVEWSACATRAMDETAQACRWRLPLAHALESWGDGRAPDGTAAIRQPLVRTLHEGRSSAQVLAMLAGAASPDGQALVRATWSDRGTGAAFDAFWSRALVDGVVAGSAPAALPPPSPAPPPAPPGARTARTQMSLTFSPDPTVFDGRYAENAWLQECPKPLTMEVWGASVAISPADAERLDVETGDHIRIEGRGGVEAPVRVTPGQADGALTAHLGGGRRAAGPIGTGVGWDLSAVRRTRAQRDGAGGHEPVSVSKASGRGRPPTFARAAELEGEARKLSPVVTPAALRAAHGEDATGRGPSLYPERPAHEPAWAMVIDAAACIGCNACVVACQAENNVPVVGPAETARGRDMHWLRIDTYLVDERPAFQPVPCMQCEHAPCEPVCPVEASVHDHEGLNAQVYNRCIGTRFCQSNCPYQVRRFNYHGYAEEQAYEDLADPAYAAGRNPDVTVRARGVMEKCTYCVQRIAGVRQTAEREGRPIRPGEVVTACQSACPTQAIRFGDLSDAADPIAAARRDVRHYALLGELGTRPRTTYLARVRNANPALEGKA